MSCYLCSVLFYGFLNTHNEDQCMQRFYTLCRKLLFYLTVKENLEFELTEMNKWSRRPTSSD